jgi:curved DNA-binding protein CbpA
MRSFENYCSVLGVNVTVTPEQLKQAYRKLVKTWHPDQFAHDSRLQLKAEAKLKEINEAYTQLQSLIASKRAETRISETRRSKTESGRTNERQWHSKPLWARKPARNSARHPSKPKFYQLISFWQGWRASYLVGGTFAILLLFKAVDFIAGGTQEAVTTGTGDAFQLGNLSRPRSIQPQAQWNKHIRKSFRNWSKRV